MLEIHKQYLLDENNQAIAPVPLHKAIGNQLARCDRQRIALTRYNMSVG